MGKYIFWIVFILLAVFAGTRFYFYLTDGFSIDNITTHLPNQTGWEVRPLSVEEQKDAYEALNQPYTYFSKGHQAYVFLSEDGKYVMKFIKFQRVRVNSWLLALPRPSYIEDWVQEKIQHKNEKLYDLFRSWVIAFNDLKEEAGLVMMHLNKTDDLKKQVVIIDKLGIKHTLDLDQTVFLIQRKGELLCPLLEKYVGSHQEEKAKSLLAGMLDLFLSEYKRGVAEIDQHILRNMGVLGDKIIHIDAGRFVKGDQYKQAEVYKNELVHKLIKFRAWLDKTSPELSAEFSHQIAEVL